jgi:hypothetical protein
MGTDDRRLETSAVTTEAGRSAHRGRNRARLRPYGLHVSGRTTGAYGQPSWRRGRNREAMPGQQGGYNGLLSRSTAASQSNLGTRPSARTRRFSGCGAFCAPAPVPIALCALISPETAASRLPMRMIVIETNGRRMRFPLIGAHCRSSSRRSLAVVRPLQGQPASLG